MGELLNDLGDALDCGNALDCSKAIVNGAQGLSGGTEGLKDHVDSEIEKTNGLMRKGLIDLFNKDKDSPVNNAAGTVDAVAALGQKNIMIYGYFTKSLYGEINILKSDDLEIDRKKDLKVNELILITLHQPSDATLRGKLLGEKSNIITPFKPQNNRQDFTVFGSKNPSLFGAIKVSYWYVSPFHSHLYVFSIESQLGQGRQHAELQIEVKNSKL